MQLKSLRYKAAATTGALLVLLFAVAVASVLLSATEATSETEPTVESERGVALSVESPSISWTIWSRRTLRETIAPAFFQYQKQIVSCLRRAKSIFFWP